MPDLTKIQQKIKGRTPSILTHKHAMNAAVILPLIEDKKGELSLLFEVRAYHLNRQPGEICFPGGRIDDTDASVQEAAIRELTEELGIHKDNVEIIAPLDIVITPFHGLIYPFVAKVKRDSTMTINHDEVDHIFTVPLSHLDQYEPEIHQMNLCFEPGNTFPLEQIANKQAYKQRKNPIQESFYYYEDYVIWGITARIMTHFLDLIKA